MDNAIATGAAFHKAAPSAMPFYNYDKIYSLNCVYNHLLSYSVSLSQTTVTNNVVVNTVE